MNLVCTWIAGPDAGGTHALPPGRHVLGRATAADLRTEDPALEPHHLLLEVGDGGTVVVTHLTGRSAVRVDGVAVDGPTERTVTQGEGNLVEVGSSLLLVRASSDGEHVFSRSDGAGRADQPVTVVRTARPPRPMAPPPPGPPPPPPPRPERPGGLLPAVLGVAGAGVVSVIVAQPMFLLFGALGGTVAIGSWTAQWWSGRRRHRQAAQVHRQDTADHAAAVAAARAAAALACRQRTPGLAAALAVASSSAYPGRRPHPALWARRAGDDDAWTVALGLAAPGLADSGLGDSGLADSGLGDSGLGDSGFEHPHTAGAPTGADLAPGQRLAITGPQALGVARAVLVQLVVQCGPADLRIVVVTDRPDRWDWCRRLPHLLGPEGVASVVTDSELPDVLAAESAFDRHVLLATDAGVLLAARTSHLRRALAGGRHALLAALTDHDHGTPQWCTAILSTGVGPTAGWVPDTAATLLPDRVRTAGLGEQRAFALAGALATLRDPEDPAAAAAAVPRQVALADLLGHAAAGPAAILATWAAAGRDPQPRTPLGLAADGAVDLDLVRDGPHGLVAGTTGAGKSELLRTLVAGLAMACPPSHLSFVLVDYKGGATFDACTRLPHVVGVITDLDGGLADRALRSLHAELRRREALLRDHGAADLAGLRALAPTVALPRLVVVIDEFAALVAEQPGFLHSLVGVAQRGRSLGVHLLLATQRPSGVISDDIRANTNLRLALRLQDDADSLDVIGDRAAATLPRAVPGRAVLRLGPEEYVTFQTAHCAHDLPRLVTAIVEAARLGGVQPPASPWCPPLPDHLGSGALPAGALGLLDDPDHQRQEPFSWRPQDGAVLVAGSEGSGVSTSLLALGRAALVGGHPVYVLDGSGSGGPDGWADPQMDVVPVADVERVLRLVHLLHRTPRHAHTQARPAVLVVRALDRVRRVLDDPATADLLDALDDLLLDGTIVTIAGVRQPAMLPARLAQAFPHRWVHHLGDPHEAGVIGVPAAAVPGPTPGRVFLAATGLTGQVAAPPAATPWPPSSPVAPVLHLPRLLDRAALPRGTASGGLVTLPLGIGVEDGEPAALHLADGDHVTVAGPARSGRSTALATLTAAWRDARPSGLVVTVAPRPAPALAALADRLHDRHDAAAAAATLQGALARRACLLVVDDADLVDDHTGALAALVATVAANPLTIAIAGRADSLRAAYGHWTSAVRRSRTGLLLAGCADLDGDVLGVVLPRRHPVRARPGLAWMAQGGGLTLVQVAGSAPDPAVQPVGPAAAAQWPGAAAGRATW